LSSNKAAKMPQIGEKCAIELLESRFLLAGAPAELLATLPAAYGNVNLNVDDSLVVNGKLFFTVDRQFDPERLYVTEGGGSATQLIEAHTYQGVSALTAYHGKLYFFASGPNGDALYA